MGQVTTTYRGGSRFYVDSENAELPRGVPGVTSIVGMLPKPFLQGWNAKMTAELAVNMVDSLPAMIQADRQGAIDYLKGAARRYTKIRADIGSEAHDVFERLIRGEAVGPLRPDIEPYRRPFMEWLDRYQPEVISAEDVAWSDRHAYAGSFDLLARVEGEVLMIDYKTSKSTYSDVSLQLTAYAFADRIIDPEGATRRMPDVDFGAVLHVTPTRTAFKPVEVSEEVFGYFLALREVFGWDREKSSKVLGRPVWSTGRAVTGTERRS